MTIKSLCIAALVGAGAAMSTAPAWAAAGDYAFEPVNAEVKAGSGEEIAVRLVHKPGGHVVPGAVVFQTRLDMAPDGMADMTSPIKPIEATEQGVYRFKADFTMPGQWALTLAAKAQGEPETVKGTVVFRAKD
jgi:hypothetical protein